MSQMPGPAQVAAEQPAVANNRPADPGAERQQNGIARSPCCAEPKLSQKCSVRIVEDGHDLPPAELLRPIEVLYCCEAALHPGDASPISGGKTRRRGADPLGRAERCFQPAHMLLNLRDPAPLVISGLELIFAEQVASRVDRNGFDIGRANIESDRVRAAHDSARPSVTAHPPSMPSTWPVTKRD